MNQLNDSLICEIFQLNSNSNLFNGIKEEEEVEETVIYSPFFLLVKRNLPFSPAADRFGRSFSGGHSGHGGHDHPLKT